MKFLSSWVIGVAGLGMGVAAHAQTPLFLDTTNAIPASSTITNNALIGVGNSREVAVGFRFGLAATSTVANITATYQSSIDGTNWVNFTTLVVPTLTSSTAVSGAVTNIVVGAIPFFRLYTTQNGATQAVSGLLHLKFTKAGF